MKQFSDNQARNETKIQVIWCITVRSDICNGYTFDIKHYLRAFIKRTSLLKIS